MNGLKPELFEIERQAPEDKIYIVSYPKSGRTWLRVLLSRYKQRLLNINDFHLKLHALYSSSPYLTPQYIFYHAGSANTHMSYKKKVKDFFKRNNNEQFSLSKCTNSKLIILIRDLRDTIVSAYHQDSKRANLFSGTISDYIRNDQLGMSRLIRFYEFLANEKGKYDHIIVAYEDMHTNINKQMKFILNFSGIDVNEEFINDSINFAQFSNMQSLEKSNFFGEKLSPKNNKDVNSYKVRKGKIGSYKDELNHEDVIYINDRITKELHSYFDRYR